MRRILTAAVLTLLATPLAAQSGGAGTPPEGWTVRADGKAEQNNVKVVPMGEGLHVTLGPAIILYQEATRDSGPFHTLASFTQSKPSKHPEGYGLFFGGKELGSEGQSYTYFLVRQDGSYLVKRRDGAKTSDVSKGWTAHPAVKKPDGKGSATNLLEVDNKVDPTKVTFKVNGQDVYTADAGGIQVDGIVGIRMNHNLDVHVEGFDVHR
ncbi:MAG: hypothetical protein H0T68_08450 [Gemmatimonadales bacterium]|nr:hypothetical protein [Gemmatimonadales bacterium]